MHCFERRFALDLRAHAGERNRKIDGLGDIIVSAERERVDDIFALAFGCDHDDGKPRGRR